MIGYVHYEPKHWNENAGYMIPEYFCVILQDGQRTCFGDSEQQSIEIAMNEFPGIQIKNLS